jgi:hypothetical protein
MDLVNSYNIELSKERQNNSNNNNSNSNKSVKLDLSDLLDDDNLVNFMQNLDYDKYLKNQETREALFLLKNKIEKEKEKEKEENLNEENKSQNNANNNSNNNHGENLSHENEEENEVNLPVIDSKINLPLYHEKEWDGKNLNEDPEILKKKIADRILKMDKVNIFYFILYYFILFYLFY